MYIFRTINNVFSQKNYYLCIKILSSLRVKAKLNILKAAVAEQDKHIVVDRTNGQACMYC